IDLNPSELARQRQSIRSRIEASGQVQNQVSTRADLRGDKFVEQVGAHDHRPGVLLREAVRSGDLLALVASEATRVRIAKQCIDPFGLARSVGCYPPGGIRNVANERLG